MKFKDIRILFGGTHPHQFTDCCRMFGLLFLVAAWAISDLKGQNPLQNHVFGELRYDNPAATPLAGVPVMLKSLLGNIVAADTTDSSGAYSLRGFANGTYMLDALPDGNWGGVNATDALQINRHFTSLLTLSPLRQTAADVNLNQAINSADALLVNRRITGLITSFSAGVWVSDRPTLTAQGFAISMNLRMLCVGDVNGSYTPTLTTPNLVLDTVMPGIRSGVARVRFISPGAGVYERGLCWGLAPSPTIAQSTATAGSGGYDFALVFGNSTWDTAVRYVRAYARTSLGVTYSNEKAFRAYS
ncbi:MAG: dockerin type I domain-containing protein, partial [Bacteroidota bacterium]